MECRAVGRSDACRFARGPGIPWSWDKSNRRSSIAEFLTSSAYGPSPPSSCSGPWSIALVWMGLQLPMRTGFPLRARAASGGGGRVAIVLAGWSRCRCGGRSGYGYWRGWAWKVAGVAGGRHFDLDVEYRTACLQLPQVRQSNPPTTTQTPRRGAAKGSAEVATLCSFPMQGKKSASAEGALRGGGAAGGGDTGAGGEALQQEEVGR